MPVGPSHRICGRDIAVPNVSIAMPLEPGLSISAARAHVDRKVEQKDGMKYV